MVIYTHGRYIGDIGGMFMEKIQDAPVARPVIVIGTTCADVVINVNRLPEKGGHCRVLGQKVMLGGCAFNVANILRQTGTPLRFVTPVGTGIYGEFVEKGLKEKGFPADISIAEENGCCYCLVEPDGERSFIPFHGGEYAFNREWVKDIDPSEYGFVYACGIEISEPTGEDIVSWLEDITAGGRGPQVFFAPSPHIEEIRPDLTERLLALHPILHMSEDESLMMSGAKDVSKAARLLREKTGSMVVITLGPKGALCLEKEGGPFVVPAVECEAADTTGAGDAHAGALIAALSRNLPLRDAVRIANEAAAAMVTVMGASLPDEYFT